MKKKKRTKYIFPEDIMRKFFIKLFKTALPE